MFLEPSLDLFNQNVRETWKIFYPYDHVELVERLEQSWNELHGQLLFVYGAKMVAKDARHTVPHLIIFLLSEGQNGPNKKKQSERPYFSYQTHQCTGAQEKGH